MINAAANGRGVTGTIRGKSSSGVVVEVVIRGGKVITAYPILR